MITCQHTVTQLEERMFLIRTLENRLQELCLQGLAGDLHFSKGQEAISVGVCGALRPSDYMVTHHRTIAHSIAKGVPLQPMLDELLGKATGLNGGIAGEMHMTCPEARYLFSFQLVATCVPVAAGLAWAVKHHARTDDIVAVFHGDAATANGQWHEGLNLAAVQRLPLLLVCENNHLAGNVRPEYYMPEGPYGRPPRLRAAGYGVKSLGVDGNDVGAVMRATEIAVRYVRQESRPFLLDCDTARLGRHKQGMGDLRSAVELEALAQRDPLRSLEIAPERRLAIESQVEAALKAALAAPAPEWAQRSDTWV